MKERGTNLQKSFHESIRVDNKTIVHEIQYGNKILELNIHPQMQEAYSYVENIDAPRLPGSTTLLYARGQQLLQEHANTTNQPIIYTLCTEYASMQQWARDPHKGKKIFGWDDITEYGTYLLATKTIIPTSDEQI